MWVLWPVKVNEVVSWGVGLRIDAIGEGQRQGHQLEGPLNNPDERGCWPRPGWQSGVIRSSPILGIF